MHYLDCKMLFLDSIDKTKRILLLKEVTKSWPLTVDWFMAAALQVTPPTFKPLPKNGKDVLSV